MARRHHYKRRTKGPAHEIDVTTFLNLMVVLVPFPVDSLPCFPRLTIVELNLPSTANGAPSDADNFRVEVIVREEGIEIGNGTAIIASLPNTDDEYDLDGLGELIVALKQEYPDHESASVLMEGHIPYDYLIQVMDIVRNLEVTDERDELIELVALFPEISVGDAP